MAIKKSAAIADLKIADLQILLLLDQAVFRNFRTRLLLAQAGTFRPFRMCILLSHTQPGLPWLRRSFVPPSLWIRDIYELFNCKSKRITSHILMDLRRYVNIYFSQCKNSVQPCADLNEIVCCKLACISAFSSKSAYGGTTKLLVFMNMETRRCHGWTVTIYPPFSPPFLLRNFP